MTKLDQSLIFRTARRARAGKITPEQCIAINIFRRRGIRVEHLSRAFGVARNTIYRRALTEGADPDNPTAVRDINVIIRQMGLEAAYAKFVTNDMVRKINAVMEEDVRR